MDHITIFSYLGYKKLSYSGCKTLLPWCKHRFSSSRAKTSLSNLPSGYDRTLQSLVKTINDSRILHKHSDYLAIYSFKYGVVKRGFTYCGRTTYTLRKVDVVKVRLHLQIDLDITLLTDECTFLITDVVDAACPNDTRRADDPQQRRFRAYPGDLDRRRKLAHPLPQEASSSSES